ncbi:hypothetical protein BOX15_Mlig019659g2, partial [Macrostomum lignano]
ENSQTSTSSRQQPQSSAAAEESRELTHEDMVYMKKCRDESMVYGQLPLTGLFSGFVWYRHRAGYYNHLPFAAVLGRYFFALSTGIVLGLVAYVPLCLSRVTRVDMVDSVLQDRMLKLRSNQQLDENSRLRVPDIGPNEPFRDPYLKALGSEEGFTTYKQRRELSRQLARERPSNQQQEQQTAQLLPDSNEHSEASLAWQ